MIVTKDLGLILQFRRGPLAPRILDGMRIPVSWPYMSHAIGPNRNLQIRQDFKSNFKNGRVSLIASLLRVKNLMMVRISPRSLNLHSSPHAAFGSRWVHLELYEAIWRTLQAFSGLGPRRLTVRGYMGQVA